MADTSIEWTDKTWNPLVGCSRVSPGCEHCYAETMAARHVLMSEAQGRRSVYLPVVDAQRRRWTRQVELLPDRLGDPISYKPGTRVFVVSMGDPFHDDVPFEYLAQMWAVMAVTPSVTYQVLTKRPERLLQFYKNVGRWWSSAITSAAKRLALSGAEIPVHTPWPLTNVWLGVSVEDQQRADERVPPLLEVPAAVRFLSCEPLLGPIDLGKWIGNYNCRACNARFWGDEVYGGSVDVVAVDHEVDPHDPGESDDPNYRHVCPSCGQPDHGTGDVGPASAGEYEDEPRIAWVIVGGESGPGARPMHRDWVRSIREQCRAAKLLDGGSEVAFFFKQWGGVNKAKMGRILDRRTHDAMPEVHCA